MSKNANAKKLIKKTKKTLDYRLFERPESELSRFNEYKHLMFVSKQLNLSI